MTYYLYHIPGKKIGVTRNLNSRVTEQQGYSPDEYEVLFSTPDIDLISRMEIELQKSYGYKVDRQSYKSLIKSNEKMKINVTDQTTTFPMPLSKLKDRLADEIGMKIETPFGEAEVTKENYRWIAENSRTSMYNINRCYIYNKKLYEHYVSEVGLKASDERYPYERETIFEKIRDWAEDRGIYERGDSKTQFTKLVEEVGELAQALLKRDDAEIYDALGDIVVVVTNLAELEGVQIEDCIEDAYDVIKNRKGEMKNGTFVKQSHVQKSVVNKPWVHQSVKL